MDTGQLIDRVRREHGVTLGEADPVLMVATIVEVVKAETLAELRTVLDEAKGWNTAGAVKELLAKAETVAADRIAARAVERSTSELVRAFNHAAEAKLRQERHVWRWLVGVGCAMPLVLATGIAFWAGRNAGRSEAAATATDLRAAFADGAPGAAEWRTLVVLNGGTIRDALRACEPLYATSGQPACKVALWTGPLPTPKAR